jgi:hypothetical protein
MTVQNVRGVMKASLLLVLVAGGCQTIIDNGLEGDADDGGGGDVAGEPCSAGEVGTTRTCCGTGTQTCMGAEIAEWGPCTSAGGQTITCPDPCVPDDNGQGCDGGMNPVCEGDGTPADGMYGTQYECYGFSNVDSKVYHLDRANKVVVPICTAPAALGPIEAFAINPLTGNSYIVAQDTSDFGKFIPRQGTQLCAYTAMGSFPSPSIGGFGFDKNGVLYAGEEGSGKVWRFTQDPMTKEPRAEYMLVGTLPNSSEGLAFHPMTNELYNSDGDTLHIVSAANPGTSLFSCSLGGGGHETIFFDKDGTLYSTNNGSQQFTKITVDRQAGTCTVTNLFSTLPGTDLEGSDCNTGGTCDTCHCIL